MIMLDVEIKPINVPSVGVPKILVLERGSICYSKQFSRIHIISQETHRKMYTI